jgi:hypothetical protein
MNSHQWLHVSLFFGGMCAGIVALVCTLAALEWLRGWKAMRRVQLQNTQRLHELFRRERE